MKTLWIPFTGIKVPVKERENGNGQDIVDAENLAASWKWGELTVIADHAGQGFDKLERVRPGTICFYGGRAFVCVSSEIGHILLSPSGNRLYTADFDHVYLKFKTGLCIYTCHGKARKDDQPVRLTHWRQI